MPSLNQVELIGNLGADPELRYTGKGKAVCNLRVATAYKPRNGPEQTEWHTVIAWDATADACAKYLQKGRQVYVAGRLVTRTYEKDGQQRKVTEIVADRVFFLGSGAGSMAPANDVRQLPPRPAAAVPPDAGSPPDDDDNVPW